MKRLDFRGKLVVVTGASSGLGREIARRLAYAEDADLVVAARRRERLEELKAEIEGRCRSRVHIVTVDLGAPDGPECLFSEATGIGDVFGLVNCAGITYYGRTLDAPPGMSERIVAVNLVAGMQLASRFLGMFLRRGSGAILAVTSIVGLVATPFQNVYSASKHGMHAFMEGLAREYRGRGIAFCTFVPGGIATEMNTLSGLDRKFPLDSAVNMGPARAARIALDALKRGRERCVPGLMNKTLVFLTRLVPRSLFAWSIARLYNPGERVQ